MPTPSDVVQRCRDIGLRCLEEHGHRTPPAPTGERLPASHFLKIGTGWSTRCMCPEGPKRLAKWQNVTDPDEAEYIVKAEAGKLTAPGLTYRPNVNRADVAADDAANTIEHHFGSPSGDRTQLRSPERSAAADETAVSTRQLQTPSSFTAALEPGEEPTQGQLFDPAETGLHR